MDKIDYKKIAYLLGCYMVIVDKEINQMEVDVLDNYLPLSFMKASVFVGSDKE